METNKDLKDTYKDDGVNVSTGDFLSKMAKEFSKNTYSNSPFVKVIQRDGYFRSPTTWLPQRLPAGCELMACNDGIGTKVVFHAASNNFQNAARDLVAMLDTDCVRFGGLPLILSNVLSLSSVGSHKKDAPPKEAKIFSDCQKLLIGLRIVANTNKLVLLGGEIAEKGVYTGSEIPIENGLRFDWEGTLTGVLDPERMITGENIKHGDTIIALKESGFRSNGISSVRKAFVKHFGEYWWEDRTAPKFIEMASVPSVSYSRFLATLNGWFNENFKPVVKVKAIAHITGGGIEGKFGQDILFRQGLSAKLDNLFEPPEIMSLCKQWRGLSDHEAYTTWNGGQGVLMVVDSNNADIATTMTLAKNFGVEAQVAGTIVKWTKPRIVINSKFSKRKRITMSSEV